MNRLASGTLSAALLALAFAAQVAWAHHGWSGNHTDIRELTGVAKVYEYIYPHALLKLERDGKEVDIVLAPPSRMSRRGLEAVSIRAGDTIKVQGYQHREHAAEWRAERIDVAGKIYELR